MADDGHRVIEMPGSAMPDWSIIPAPETGSVFLTTILSMIQLLGIVGIGKGVWETILFFKPNEPKAPPSLAKPSLMVIFGMFAIVPSRVYDAALVTLQQLGWL